jgi:hypothetical protein
MEQARVAMRVKTYMASLVKKLDGYGAYYPSKSPADKLKGAFIVLGTIMKLRTVPISKFGNCVEDEVSLDKPNNCVQRIGKVLGMLRKAALSGDGQKIAQILQQYGRSTQILTPALLVKLWGFNEHMHLHNVLRSQESTSTAHQRR